MGASQPPAREPALDVARGIALVAMVAIHFVPTEGATNFLEQVAAEITAFVWDKCASLFCLVAGMAWMFVGGSAQLVLRRAGLLFGFGVLFRVTLWPTEILSPLALMMLLAHPLRSKRAFAAIAVIVLLLAGVPIVTELGAELVAADWYDDGAHRATTEFGWATLRYYLFDGDYPLLPWLVFPLIGMLYSRGDWQSQKRASTVFWLSLPIALGSHAYRVWSDERWLEDELADVLAVTWEPVSSVPFVIVGLSSALAVVAGLLWLANAAPRAVPRLRVLECLGRASLTHYVLHITVGFAPLRVAYPDEEWPVGLGLIVFVAYLAFAAPASIWWFQRFKRGPLEGLWARASRRA